MIEEKLAKLQELRKTHSIEEMVEELELLNITIEDLEEIYETMVAR